MYDPSLGRFMSADLFVQSPYSSQSFNRYTYVSNNPLSRVDPTGYAEAMGCAGSYSTKEVPGSFHSFNDCNIGGLDSGVEAIGDANNIARNIDAQTVDLRQQDRESAVDRELQRLLNSCIDGSLGACVDHNDLLVGSGGFNGVYLPHVLKDFYKRSFELASSGGLLKGGVGLFSKAKELFGSRAGVHTPINIGNSRKAVQIEAKATQSSAVKELVASGYSKSPTKTPEVFVLRDGEKTYTMYPRSTGGGIPGPTTGVPSAEVRVNGELISKIRFLEGL